MSSRTAPSLNALLNRGIAACQSGDLPGARQALIAALKIDPQSELGWLWLSSALTDPKERRACLQRVLALNPQHTAARDGLKWLSQQYPPGAPPAPAAEAPKTPEAAAPKPAPPPEPAEAAETPEVAGPEPEPAALIGLPPAEAEEEEAEPSWLAHPAEPTETPAPTSAAETIAEIPQQPAAHEPASSPSWLDAALQRAEARAPLPGHAAESAETEELPAEAQAEPEKPSWLAASLRPSEAGAPTAEEAEAEAEEEASPEWLEDALQDSKKTAPFAQQEAEAAAPADEEVPSWLAEVNQPSGKSASALSSEAEVEASVEEEEVPSWLAEVNQQPGQSAPAVAAPFADEAETDEAETMTEGALTAARPRARLETTACPWCGNPVSGMDLTCPSCSRPLEFECPQCGNSIAPEEAACPNCGWAAGDFQHREAYLQHLGEAYLAKDAAHKALPIYRYLAELTPDSVPVFARLSQIYQKLGRTEQGVAAAERVLELDPNNVDALDRLGRWYVLRGDFEKVAEIVSKVEHMPEHSPRLTLLLGDLEFERRQYPAAFRAYRAAAANVDIDPPTQARLSYRLGEMYLVAEDQLSALRAFQASVATESTIHEVDLARQRIDQLRPPLPPSATRSASETLRAMAGPLLLVWLTGLVQMGFRAQNLSGALVVGLFAAVPGSYLIASAVSTPTAIEWRTLLGEKGLTTPMFGAIVAMLGAAIEVTSIVLILFGS